MYINVLLSYLGISAASLLRSARHLAEHRRLTSLLRGVGLRKSPFAALLIFLGMVMRRSVRWRNDVQSDKNEAFTDSLPCHSGVALRTFCFSGAQSICRRDFSRFVGNSLVLVNLRYNRSLSRTS